MSNDEKLIACASLDSKKTTGVEFTEGKARNLFNELPGSMALQFVDKQLPPLAVYALQQAVNTLGEILHTCIEIVMYNCLKNESVNQVVNKAIDRSVQRGIELYFQNGNGGIYEASEVWKAYMADYEIPKCEDVSVVADECKPCTAYQGSSSPPQLGDVFDKLKEKLMEVLEEVIKIAIEKGFNTTYFGIVISNWCREECTGKKIEEIMKEISDDTELSKTNYPEEKVTIWEPNLTELRKVNFKILKNKK